MMSPFETELLSHCRHIRSQQAAEGTEISAICRLPADLAPFAGHFPGRPILPAVLQLTLVRLLAARALGQSLLPLRVRRCKFNQVIGPEENVCLKITLGREAPEIIEAHFTFTIEGQRASSGTLTYTSKMPQ